MEPRAGTSPVPERSAPEAEKAGAQPSRPRAVGGETADPVGSLRWAGGDALSEFPTEAEVGTTSAAGATRAANAAGTTGATGVIRAARAIPATRPAARPSTDSRRKTLTASALVLLLLVVAAAAWRWQGSPVAPGESAAGATGTLSIESSPAGAAVLIDGRERGTAPLTLQLGTGLHHVVLKAGGVSRNLDITIAGGAQVVHHVELGGANAATGRLHIDSRPTAALVAVDGVGRGTTPIDLAEMTAGDHEVTVGEGTGALTQRVNVPPGGMASLIVPLVQGPAEVAPAWISVVTPVELQVFEGDSLLGTSRSERIMVQRGQHTLRLTNPDLGFETTRAVQAQPGRVATVRVEIPSGALSVNAVPWAEVLLDGRRIGETPIANLLVPIGSHELTLRNPKFPEQKRSVMVTLSAPTRVGVDLRQ